MSHAEEMPSAPSAPPQYEGYSNLGFVQVNQKEAYEPKPQEIAASRKEFAKVPYVTEEEALEALAVHVSEHCCYGKGPLKKLKFDYIESSDAFRYVLQTYTETRTTGYASVPYSGEPIYVTGLPPGPWDIAAVPKILFNNETLKIEIPNTAHVENCSKCMGVGHRTCHACSGIGTKKCHRCFGRGRISAGIHNPGYDTFNENHHEHHGHHGNHGNHGHHGHHGHHEHGDSPCLHCNGSGFEGCHVCHRLGKIQCNICKSSGKLKWFLQLTIKFENQKNDFLKQNASNLPDELMRKCQAQNVFSEQNIRVSPLNHHPDAQINAASSRLLSDHASRFVNSRILAQRHDLNVIPITQCMYTWKETQHDFQIYGLDQIVYAPNYPKKCCCTIL